jgi:class 3 adenylate cyclase
MPTYIDIHDAPGVTSQDVANAHSRDMHVQGKHGVEYVKYWHNHDKGKIFCLCTAPNAEAAAAVHAEAHGLVAGRIMEVTPDIAEAFMGASEVDEGGAALVPGGAERDPGTRTILFTDIVGSTDMTQHLGDELAFTLLEIHDRVVRHALSEVGGREVKHTGDGIMAAFHSAACAVRCGIHIQEQLSQHRNDNPKEPLRVRIGIAVGEPIERSNDLFGTTVQLAARLCAHAEPEQILVSNAVAELCLGKALPLKDAGRVALKGFSEPVHVHCVTCAA